jgi:hypothetical protein
MRARAEEEARQRGDTSDADLVTAAETVRMAKERRRGSVSITRFGQVRRRPSLALRRASRQCVSLPLHHAPSPLALRILVFKAVQWASVAYTGLVDRVSVRVLSCAVAGRHHS